MTTGSITVIGSLMVDHIFFVSRLPDIGETFPANEYKKAPGGKGANSAIATYRSCHCNPSTQLPNHEDFVDIKVRMVGAVAKDTEGGILLNALSASLVDVGGVREVDPKSTEMSTGMMFVMVQEMDDTKDNRLISTQGANAVLKAEDFASAEDLLCSNGVLPDLIISQLELDLRAIETLLKTAYKAGIAVLLNAAPANAIDSQYYSYVTHLVVNQTEAATLSGRDLDEVKPHTWDLICKDLLGFDVENVVITLGAEGAYYANHYQSGHVKTLQVDLVDPTGAGDTFTGAYAAEYVRQRKVEGVKDNWDIKKAVERACAAGTLTVSKAGAQEGIPWADAIDDALRKTSGVE
ncbi:hypothetical protein Q7P37_002302 [Cladosporium fusiforme]